MTHETVLIVEDDPIIRTLLERSILSSADYRVLMAANGQEGLSLILDEQPDVVLLDLSLPLLHGLEVMRELRRRDRELPIIVLTAHSDADTILQAFRLGAKEFLPKPFSTREVRSALENALAEERLRREKENLTHALAQANKRLHHQLENWVLLNDIARTIISSSDEAEVFRRVVENVTRILEVEAGSLLVVDEKTNMLQFAVTMDGDAARFLDINVKMGQGFAGWVAMQGEPLRIANARDDPRFWTKVDEHTGFETQSVLCVPLKVKGEVIGVLEVINKIGESGGTAFSEEDLELLDTLTSWVTVAVENARLNRSMQEAAAAKALDQAVITLAHHINNLLMSCSLELDSLEREGTDPAIRLRAVMATARECMGRTQAVIKALDRLTGIPTVSYAGVTEMIDIEAVLEEELQKIEADFDL